MIVPVIHCQNWNQIKYNLDICSKNGINFVFMINHGHNNPVDNLSTWVKKAKTEYQNIKFGVNFLQLSTADAIITSNNLGADAIWSDYPVIYKPSNKIPLFGPVAFKYQKHVAEYELESVCKEAMNYMDVITTSGPATGKPASLKKIEDIRKYIGNFPLAIASGVNKENKKIFDPLVDYMLVASSITDSAEMIIESKLIELLNS